MTNLKEKIQILLKDTDSAEVKTICESFLKKASNKEKISYADQMAVSLFENLKSYVEDPTVKLLLNDKTGFEQSITEIESQISKNAAKNLLENWETVRRDKKVTNVGNHINNLMKDENKNAAKENIILNEKLASTEIGKKITSVDNYMVKESILKIKNDKISEHLSLKYILAKFENKLDENQEEFTLVRDFVSSLEAFKWSPIVQESINDINKVITKKAADLEVQNAINSIRNTDHQRFFTDITNRMNEWLYSEKKNVYDLIKEMKGYVFNPYIKDLTNNLLLLENTKGTKFNIPVKDSNCIVSKIYSPVLLVESGQIFRSGNNFYISTETKLSKLTEAQINALPKNYLELCEAFFNPSVKVTDDNIFVFVGKSKVKFTEDGRVFINEKQIEPSTLSSQLLYHTQQNIFNNNANIDNVVMTISENLNNICEIDFGKNITSSVFEGLGVNIFKKADKIYLNRFNDSMNENSFVKATPIQAVNAVKHYLSFDMSESLLEFLEGDYKKKALMESNITLTMSNIEIVEKELNKIETLILADPFMSESNEIQQAKTLLETELAKLKAEWQNKNIELKKFQNILEEEEEEIEEPEELEEEPVEPESTEETPEIEDTETTELEMVEEPAVTPTEPTVATGVVDSGLLGANGAQNATIQTDAPSIVSPTTGIVDSGYAGASGTQVAGIDVSQIQTTEKPVITPGPVAGVIQQGVTPGINQQEPTNNIAPSEEEMAAVNANVPTVGEETEETMIASEPTEEKPVDDIVDDEESKSNEAITLESIVKDKSTGKNGKVTGVNDEKFSVLLDDGETVERTLSDLTNADEEIESAIADNEKETLKEDPDKTENGEDDEKKTTNENEEVESTEGDDIEKPVDAMYVQATLTLDLGPFKAGDPIEIEAAGFTASGDDDPVKLKEPKEGVSEIPKKYLKIADSGNSEADVDTQVADVLQQIQNLETFLKEKNISGSKAIEAAKEEIKKFAETLGTKKEDDKSEEEN